MKSCAAAILWSCLCLLTVPSLAQTNLLVMQSPPGDYIGQGLNHVTTDGASISLTGNRSYIAVTTPFGYWIEFKAPDPEELAVQVYSGALRYPFNGGNPGLTISGNGRGCNTVAGSFEIKELGFDEAGNPNRLWAIFSHSCEGFMPALVGEVRYHANLSPEVVPRTLHVPGEYPGIQSAINAAAYIGDTIRVGPGRYPEGIDFLGKQVAIEAEVGEPFATILEPPAPYGGVRSASGETTNSVLRGFTIINAPIGIGVSASSPLLVGNTISNCTTGILLQGSGGLIVSNWITSCGPSGVEMQGVLVPLIQGNQIERSGGGIAMNGGSPQIYGNLVRSNATFGMNFDGGSDPGADVTQNVVYGNGSHGIRWRTPAGSRAPYLIHNTIIGNLSSTAAAVQAEGWDARGLVVNNVIVGRPALYLAPDGDIVPPPVEHNLLFAWDGPAITGSNTALTNLAGNVWADPLFLDVEGGDFQLTAGSPAIDQAQTNSLPVDFLGVSRPIDGDGDATARSDLGAYEFVMGPPRPPSGLTAIAFPTRTEVNWRLFDRADDYLLFRGLSAEGPFTEIGSTDSTFLADTNIVTGTVYYYAVAGRNALGTGRLSAAVAVKAGNRPPVAAPRVIGSDEDERIEIEPLAGVVDPDGDPLTLSVLGPPPGPGFVLTSSNTVQYLPPLNFSGTNSFTFVARDGRHGAVTSLVTIIVRPVNDPPEAHSGVHQVRANTNSVLTLAFTDPDSSTAEVILSQLPEHGLIQPLPNGKVQYRPAHGYVGYDSFQSRISDGTDESNDATTEILVTAPFDIDSDGLPDAWEWEWDLNNAQADPDQDGMTSLEEYYAGTAPRDPGSLLEIIALTPTSEGGVAISWRATGGVRYRIYSADRLTGNPADFQPVLRSAGHEIDPGGEGVRTVRTFIDPRPMPPNGARFYRIQVVQ